MNIENIAVAETENKEIKKTRKNLPPLMVLGIAALVLILIVAISLAIAEHADSSGQKRTHGVYSVNADDVLDIAPFSSGLAVLTSRSVDYVDAFGNLMSANEQTYTNPVIKTAGKNMILYDRGGSAMRIEKNASEYQTFEFDASVSCADITAKGTYAYALNADSGYQSHVFAYSYKGVKLYEWSSSEYVMRTVLSPGGNYLAVSTISVLNAQSVSKVYLFQFTKGTHEYVVEFTGETVFDIGFISARKVVVLTDRGAYQLSPKGEKEVLCEFSANELNHTDLYMNGMGIAAINLYGNTNSTKVYLFSKGYKNVFEQEYQNAISMVTADDSYCAIVFDKEIRILNTKNVQTGLIKLDEVCLDTVISGGKLYVLTAGGMDQYGLHETDGENE